MPTALVLTSTFPGAINDGSPQFVYDLTSRIESMDRIIVIAPRVPGAPRRERIGPIEIRRFAYFWKRFEGVANGATLPNVRAEPWRLIELPFLFAAFYLQTLWALVREPIDVVHAHWVIPSGLMAALVPKRWRRPMIATAHGVDLHAQRRFPIDQLRRFTLKRTAQVVAVSSDLEQIVVELSPKTPVITAPMGTDFSEVIRQTEPRVPTAGQIAFLGRLADKKGVDVLLRAVAGIPDATLLIAGDGPERPRLDALAVELGIGDRVTFLGRTARAQVYELLRTCAVLCIPSVVGVDGDQEGTPVVFAEACAAGVPVVASTIGGLGELLDESTGYPVEAGNVDALRRGLEAALTDPSAAQAKAETAREHLAETLDLRAIASLYDRMYRDLAAG